MAVLSSLPSYDRTRNIAVVIGINRYEQGVAPLQTAVSDACAIAKMLREKLGYHQVILYLDGDATLARLQQLFQEKLPQQIKKNDRLLIYFAGHGVAHVSDDGPAGYLLPQDANAREVSSYLSMQALYKAISDLPCRHLLLLLDCCFAGSFRWAAGVRKIIPIPEKLYRQRFERFSRSAAWQVLTSAAYDQGALDVLQNNRRIDSQSPDHSPFAAALLQALAGEADLIQDGVVTVTELYLYLRDRVETDSQERQTPGLWPLPNHQYGEFFFLMPDFDFQSLESAPDLKPDRNPYRGLTSYESEQGAIFFGRDVQVQQLYSQQIIKHSLTVVVGASGTGKSSLVKAGLVPFLNRASYLKRRQRFQSIQPASAGADEQWQVLEPLRPNQFPLLSLARTVLPLAIAESSATRLQQQFLENDDTLAMLVDSWLAKHSLCHVMLIVDQAEELITLASDCAQCDRFIVQLEQAMLVQPNRFHCVFTLRTDFEPLVKQLFSTQWQADWVRQARWPVLPMTQAELRQAIEGPAHEVALQFEPPSLVDDLINEVVQMPGALPLLSFTLSELYIKCYERFQAGDLNRALTQIDYENLGCVSGALRSRANMELTRLDAATQRSLRNMMLRMVTLEGGELARRRVFKNELVFADAAENQRVESLLTRLVEQRLLTSGRTDEANYIEPAHDVLIRGWEKISDWLSEKTDAQEKPGIFQRVSAVLNVKARITHHPQPLSTVQQSIKQQKFDLALQRQTTAAAANWQSLLEQGEVREAQRSLWPRDPRLDQLAQFCKSDETRGHWLNQLELDFIQSSIALKNTIFRNWVIGIVCGFSILSSVTAIALRQSQLAINREAEAQAQAINALNQVSQNHLQQQQFFDALLAATRAGQLLKKQPSPDTKLVSQVIGKLQASTSAVREVSRFEGELLNTLVRYDRFMIRDSKGSIKLMDRAGQTISVLHTTPEFVSQTIISDDEALIGTIHFNRRTLEHGSTIWDKDGNKVDFGLSNDIHVNKIAFSPNSQKVAVIYKTHPANRETKVAVWNRDGKSMELPHQITGHIKHVRFSPDGEMVAAIYVYDDLIHKGTSEGIKLWDSAGNPIDLKQALPIDQTWTLKELKFVPGRSEILTIFHDKNNRWLVELWDKQGNLIERVPADSNTINQVAFSPDGKLAALYSNLEPAPIELYALPTQTDTPVQWKISSEEPTVIFPKEGETVQRVVFGHKSHKMMVDSTNQNDQHNVRLYDTGDIRSISNRLIVGDVQYISEMSASDNDKTFFVVYAEKRNEGIMIETFDVSGAHLDSLTLDDYSPGHLATGLDHQTFAVTHREHNDRWITRLQSYQDNTVPSLLIQENALKKLVISPDSESMISVHRDDTNNKRFSNKIADNLSANVWDRNGNLVGSLVEQASTILSLSFSADSNLIAVGYEDSQENVFLKLWTEPDNSLYFPVQGRADSDYGLSISPNSELVSFFYMDEDVGWRLKLWDSTDGSTHVVIDDAGWIMHSFFSPDSQFLAVPYLNLSNECVLSLWNTFEDSKQELTKDCSVLGIIDNISFSSDSQFLITHDEQDYSFLFSTQSGYVQLLDIGGSWIETLVFTNNGKSVAGSYEDDNGAWNIALWDRSGHKIATLLSDVENVTNLTFDEEHQTLLTIYQDTDGTWSVMLWKDNGKIVDIPVNSFLELVDVALSPDGQRIVIADGAETIQIWDTESLTVEFDRKYAGQLQNIEFSPDGQFLVASLSLIHQLSYQFWQVDGTHLDRRLMNSENAITEIAFSPDGKQMLVGTSQNKLYLWPTDLSQLLDPLIENSCEWLKHYLASRPKEQKDLCPN